MRRFDPCRHCAAGDRQRFTQKAQFDNASDKGKKVRHAACLIGMPKLEFITRNTAMAKEFRPLPEAERRDLSLTLSSRNKQALDRYFRRHIDA